MRRCWPGLLRWFGRCYLARSPRSLHGNPTWSFLYRHIVSGLKDRFRCIAPDYPGFGLSTAPDGYRYTIAEHARILEGFIEQLDLRDITMMVQDWGGPIGMWSATRHPERFRAFVIGNTWAWPLAGDKTAERFSKLVWADKDQAFKEPQRLRWEQTFPDHRTVILRGASHYIQEDAPEEILAAISEWSPSAATG